jgi:hypothetical protein
MSAQSTTSRRPVKAVRSTQPDSDSFLTKPLTRLRSSSLGKRPDAQKSRRGNRSLGRQVGRSRTGDSKQSQNYSISLTDREFILVTRYVVCPPQRIYDIIQQAKNGARLSFTVGDMMIGGIPYPLSFCLEKSRSDTGSTRS